MTGSTRSLLRLPAPHEAYLYVRNNGLRRSLAKFFCAYVAGRQRWYLTCEDLTRYAGTALVPGPYEYRFATRDDLPRMSAFETRMSRSILRAWFGREYLFFITLYDGLPVSYRTLSPLVHPGVVGAITLRPGQIFMVDEFTVPAFRRRGITRQMAIAMTPSLLARGYREVLGIHRTDNDDTVKAAGAKGIPRVGTITRSCFLGSVSFRFEPNDTPASVEAALTVPATGSPTAGRVSPVPAGS